MDRIAQAVEKLKGYTWVKIASVPAIEKYVSSGEEASLRQIAAATASASASGQRVGNFWGHTLAAALRPPPQWQEDDRRLVRVLWAANLYDALWSWLDRQLAQEKAGEDFLALAGAEAKIAGDAVDLLHVAVGYLSKYEGSGRPTSAGRVLLAADAAAITAELNKPPPRYYRALLPLGTFLARHGPKVLAEIADALLSPMPRGVPVEIATFLLRHDGATFEAAVARSFEAELQPWVKFKVGTVLYDYAPSRYGAAALAAARASFRGPVGSNNHGPVGTWMLDHFGRDVLPDIEGYFDPGLDRNQMWAEQIVNDAVRVLGKDAMQTVLRALQQKGRIRRRALDHLIRLDGEKREHEALIRRELEQGLASKDAEEVVAYIQMAGKWDAAATAEQLWGLFEHKSKVVRGAAARGLAKSGEPAVRRAGELLQQKKGDMRAAAVTLLSAAATPQALALLEARLDEEASEDVRDQILMGLSAAWEGQGRKLTRADVEARIAKAAAKLKEPVAAWAVAEKLPPLRWRGGGGGAADGTLSQQAVAYLIYRQSRAKEIRPDIEAAPMYELIDRAGSGEFARAILKGFLASKQEAADKWALALAGLLGDDRIVPELVAQIREWVDHNRGKLAEWAVQALALLASDAALLAVDAMAIRYRNKMKNVGKAAAEAFVAAAEKQGITPDELGDRVVPWLGFEPGKPRIIEAGKTRVEVTIGPDLKFAYKDLDKGKPIKSLPKTVAKEVLDELKDASANLKEVAKAQVLRLENLLVRQRRWPASEWKRLFLGHPVLLPLATRLVWGHYDEAGRRVGAFRAMADGTLTSSADEG